MQMADRANRYRKNVTFKVGDIIFLNNKNINTKRPFRKLNYKRYGPFKVLELIESSYRLDLPASMRIHNVFHANMLSLASINPLPKQINPPPEPIVINN